MTILKMIKEWSKLEMRRWQEYKRAPFAKPNHLKQPSRWNHNSNCFRLLIDCVQNHVNVPRACIMTSVALILTLTVQRMYDTASNNNERDKTLRHFLHSYAFHRMHCTLRPWISLIVIYYYLQEPLHPGHSTILYLMSSILAHQNGKFAVQVFHKLKITYA